MTALSGTDGTLRCAAMLFFPVTEMKLRLAFMKQNGNNKRSTHISGTIPIPVGKRPCGVRSVGMKSRFIESPPTISPSNLEKLVDHYPFKPVHLQVQCPVCNQKHEEQFSNSLKITKMNTIQWTFCE